MSGWEGWILAVLVGLFTIEIRRWLLGAGAANAPARLIRVLIVAFVLISLSYFVFEYSVPIQPTDPTTTDRTKTDTGGTTATGTTITVTGDRSRPPTPGSETITSHGCELVKVPAGACIIGCTHGDRECTPKEELGRQVSFSAFYIMQAEVTQAEYNDCVSAGDCQKPEVLSEENPTMGPSLPVTFVDGFDAVRFCTWIGGRLPTEAEWEYAARTGDSTFRYPWGMEFKTGQAVYGLPSEEQPSVVRTTPPNKWGLFDMSGNVAEYATGETESDGSTAIVLRGGSYASSPAQLRVSFRNPTNWHSSGKRAGLRCVIDRPPSFTSP